MHHQASLTQRHNFGDDSRKNENGGGGVFILKIDLAKGALKV